MKKKLYTFTALSVLFMAMTVPASDESAFYKEYVERENIGTVQEYYSDELTGEMLENRKNALIIEKVIGVCIDDDGNGKTLNPENPDFDYISYNSVNGVTKGDVLLTILIYNPGNNYVDDIVDRFDYVIDHLQ